MTEIPNREVTQRQLHAFYDQRRKLRLQLACVEGVIKDLEEMLWHMEAERNFYSG